MKIRFGDIVIGNLFNAFGLELVKLNEYNARTTSLQEKQKFLFKKEILSKG